MRFTAYPPNTHFLLITYYRFYYCIITVPKASAQVSFIPSLQKKILCASTNFTKKLLECYVNNKQVIILLIKCESIMIDENFDT